MEIGVVIPKLLGLNGVVIPKLLGVNEVFIPNLLGVIMRRGPFEKKL